MNHPDILKHYQGWPFRNGVAENSVKVAKFIDWLHKNYIFLNDTAYGSSTGKEVHLTRNCRHYIVFCEAAPDISDQNRFIPWLENELENIKASLNIEFYNTSKAEVRVQGKKF